APERSCQPLLRLIRVVARFLECLIGLLQLVLLLDCLAAAKQLQLRLGRDGLLLVGSLSRFRVLSLLHGLSKLLRQSACLTPNLLPLVIRSHEPLAALVQQEAVVLLVAPVQLL